MSPSVFLRSVLPSLLWSASQDLVVEPAQVFSAHGQIGGQVFLWDLVDVLAQYYADSVVAFDRWLQVQAGNELCGFSQQLFLEQHDDADGLWVLAAELQDLAMGSGVEPAGYKGGYVVGNEFVLVGAGLAKKAFWRVEPDGLYVPIYFSVLVYHATAEQVDCGIELVGRDH